MAKGVKPEWQALPKKKCDNCGASFKPFQPDQRFCQANCRKEFNKRGGSFSKLKPIIVKEVRARIKELRPIDGEWITAIEKRLDLIERFIGATRTAALLDFSDFKK